LLLPLPFSCHPSPKAEDLLLVLPFLLRLSFRTLHEAKSRKPAEKPKFPKWE
jgi:hypothetical protein